MDIAKDVFKLIDLVTKRAQNDRPLSENAANIDVTCDIVYNEAFPDVCKLDTYALRGVEGLYPVLFYIHGGGFVAGGKEFRKGLSSWYADNGIFVVNVNYGLCPDFTFPEPLKHLILALNWVVDNAQALRLDLQHMFVSGDSAGGYYAAMLAACTTSKKLQKVFGIKPKATFGAAVLNCGLYDIDAAMKSKKILNLDEKLFKQFTGVELSELNDYEYKDFFTPLNHITKKFPPTFVVYAEKDVFCGGQGECLIEKFKENDVYYERFFSTTFLSNHCFSLNWKDGDARVANALTMDFVERFLNDKIRG